MKGGALIREARKRAGLSQRELAELLHTTQPQIARWENEQRSPSFERLVEAIRRCGFDLSVRIVARDEDHALLVERSLMLSPEERLRHMSQSRSAIRDLVASARAKS